MKKKPQADLNRKIAEFLESVATLPEFKRDFEPGHCVLGIDTNGDRRWFSPKSSWIFYSVGGWKPRAFDTDPACRQMLRERLLAEGWNVTYWADSQPRVSITEQATMHRGIDAESEAEAFAKAHGLEVE